MRHLLFSDDLFSKLYTEAFVFMLKQSFCLCISVPEKRSAIIFLWQNSDLPWHMWQNPQINKSYFITSGSSRSLHTANASFPYLVQNVIFVQETITDWRFRQDCNLQPLSYQPNCRGFLSHISFHRANHYIQSSEETLSYCANCTLSIIILQLLSLVCMQSLKSLFD